MKNGIEWMVPEELRNHPTNIAIYGDTPDPELMESVRKHGVFPDHPIGYVLDGDFRVIVSGHRRNQAAKMTKQESVPCVRLKELEGDDLAIRERIILSNKQRIKTTEQLAREAAQLAEISEERTKTASAANLRQNSQKQASSTELAQKAKSVKQTREAVSESLGVGEKTARNLIDAGKALVKAESTGDTAKATEIKKGLEKSPAAGAKAAKPPAAPPPNPAHRQAGNLLAKASGDLTRVRDALGPLVCAFDEIKAGDASFAKRHKELLGHHSRLFKACEESADAMKALRAAWERK